MGVWGHGGICHADHMCSCAEGGVLYINRSIRRLYVRMTSTTDEAASRQAEGHANHDVSAPNAFATKASNETTQAPPSGGPAPGLGGVGGGGGATSATSATDILKAAVQASDPDALTKLLEHIESLKHSNAEMSQTLDGIQKKNMEKYHVEVQEKIQPWVTSLNIPEEQKASFLQGIQLACEQGMKKRGVIDYQSNPAFSIACAAAEAHGTAIQSAENFRVQLMEANTKVERVKEEESANYNNNRLRQHAILSSALTDDKQSDDSKKRKSGDMYNTSSSEQNTEQSDTKCWSTVFDRLSRA